MHTTVAIRELRACLTVALGLALGPACRGDLPTPGCSQTERAAETKYVCFDPATQAPASTSSVEMTSDDGEETTASGTSRGASETTPSTESSGAGETTASTDSTDTSTGPGLCDAFVGGPPNTLYDDYTGPIEDDGLCCYTVVLDDDEEENSEATGSICGRPFVVDGDARVAPCVERSDWVATLHPIVDGIDPATREALAAAWMRDAAAEHASVAAFARFALQLLTVAAPPELVLETQRAMADEIEHARMCFALASAYAGAPIGPGALSMASGSACAIELADVAASTMIEGCLGETLAALVARISAAHATDPIVRGVLERIADDELRHAALAWRFVAWAVGRGDARVRSAIVRALEAPLAVPIADDDTAGLRRHGRLSAVELHALQRRVRAEVIDPLARSLLAAAAANFLAGQVEPPWAQNSRTGSTVSGVSPASSPIDSVLP